MGQMIQHLSNSTGETKFTLRKLNHEFEYKLMVKHV